MDARPRPAAKEPPATTVALFVTCLVDLFRPAVGLAAAQLLEQAGFDLCVPAQGCCGQPNFNSGDRDGARRMAAGIIEQFAGFDYVVAPSGSCAAMLRHHYPALFDDDSATGRAARDLADRTWELTSFLVDVAGVASVDATFDGVLTYQDACSGLRELGVRGQPRRLLSTVAGSELREMEQPDACCGFGGLFCVKYPEVSGRIADAKIDAIVATGADIVVAGDLGCLLQIEGRLHRLGKTTRAVHVAEVLAGTIDGRNDADDE